MLEVDGIQINEGEIEAFYPYLDSVTRRLGRNARIMGILDQHVLPLKLAQRAFGADRATLQRSCQALRDAVGNEGYLALKNKGRLVVGHQNDMRAARYELPLAIAEFSFDQEQLYQVSPALETPQGFCLISSSELIRGPTREQDAVVAYQVSFYTHDAQEFATWLATAKAAARGKVNFVHPDYRDAVPPWLNPR